MNIRCGILQGACACLAAAWGRVLWECPASQVRILMSDGRIVAETFAFDRTGVETRTVRLPCSSTNLSER